MSDGRLGAFFGYAKEKKIIWILAAALILGIAMMLLPDSSEGGAASSAAYADTDKLEQKVAELCGRIDGVGTATVMITLDTVGEQTYAFNSRTLDEGDGVLSEKEYVSASGGLVPTGERLSTVRGVAVVCSGGGNPSVKLALTELLCALFSIPSSSVHIASGN